MVEQGLQLLKGKAVTLPVAMHEVLQKRGCAEGGPCGHSTSLRSSCPHDEQGQQEAAGEGWAQQLHGDG